MIITNTINVDLARPGASPSIDAVQDDKYSRDIEVKLYSNGSSLEIPNDVKVVASYEKPDGTGGVYDTLPDGSSAWSVKGNVVTISLAPQVLTVAGRVFFSLTLISGNTEISTFVIVINVHGLPNFTASSEDYVSLGDWISDELKRVLSEAKENGEFAPFYITIKIEANFDLESGFIFSTINQSWDEIQKEYLVGRTIVLEVKDSNGKEILLNTFSYLGDSMNFSGIDAKTKTLFHAYVDSSGDVEISWENINSGVTSWNDLTDKPFGEDGEDTEIFPEQTLLFQFVGDGLGTISVSPSPIILVEGETYYVVYDGEEHEIVCVTQNGALMLSYSVLGEDGEPTDGSFAVSYDAGSDMVTVVIFDSTNTANHTFALYQKGIKTLDAKYLPMDAIDARIDAYIEEALGGEF